MPQTSMQVSLASTIEDTIEEGYIAYQMFLTYLAMSSPLLPNRMRSQFLLFLDPNDGYFLIILYRLLTEVYPSSKISTRSEASSLRRTSFLSVRLYSRRETLSKLVSVPVTSAYSPQASLHRECVFLINVIRFKISLGEKPKDAIQV